MADGIGVQRGEVWWVSVPGLGERPALVVSAESMNRALGEVTLARITALERERALPTYVALVPGEVDGLPARSYVLCHNLYTLSKATLRTCAGRLGALRMVEVESALRFALDLRS